jgi:NAD(P)-dependent dehydrogenase (short-subunit alcohol dehydrogenase family)
MSNWRLLVFGASGAIGSAVTRRALERGWSVTGVSRSAPPAGAPELISWISYDPLAAEAEAGFPGERPYNGVCWAQGANLADSLHAFDAERHLELYSANCLSVMISASALVQSGLLSPEGARLTMVSSIWQERARGNKLSYTVTKAAVGGLVRSASVDLGEQGHLVNGVLPGVLDTPMTAANLDPEQIAAVASMTPLGRLPDLDTLAELICFLCSPDNNSITGQSIAVDLGMSNVRLL